MKALAKRANDRYSTAEDFGTDLQLFVDSYTAKNHDSPSNQPSEVNRTNIVPKGLRSFDAEDATFFLQLLPGPKDRQGLPESIRFWNTRIETRDPTTTFAVGLIVTGRVLVAVSACFGLN